MSPAKAASLLLFSHNCRYDYPCGLRYYLHMYLPCITYLTVNTQPHHAVERCYGHFPCIACNTLSYPHRKIKMGTFGIIRKLFKKLCPGNIVCDAGIHKPIGQVSFWKSFYASPAESPVCHCRQQYRSVLDRLTVDLNFKQCTLF